MALFKVHPVKDCIDVSVDIRLGAECGICLETRFAGVQLPTCEHKLCILCCVNIMRQSNKACPYCVKRFPLKWCRNFTVAVSERKEAAFAVPWATKGIKAREDKEEPVDRVQAEEGEIGREFREAVLKLTGKQKEEEELKVGSYEIELQAQELEYYRLFKIDKEAAKKFDKRIQALKRRMPLRFADEYDFRN